MLVSETMKYNITTSETDDNDREPSSNGMKLHGSYFHEVGQRMSDYLYLGD